MMIPRLPKRPRINLSATPLDPLRKAIRDSRRYIERAGNQLHSLADEIRGVPLTDQTRRRSPEQPKGMPLATTVPQTSSLQDSTEKIATGCLPCAIGHFSTSSGLLKEATRFKHEGMSNEILDRIAAVLEEQNALERKDLSPEKIQGLPEWERVIAEEALAQSRQLRHRLESIQGIDDLGQIAADTRKYYLKLNRQWYRGRFSKLGTKKAEAIAQRVGGNHGSDKEMP